MPAQAEAKMKNRVMARSRTARAERLKLRMGPLFLSGQVHDLAFAQEVRSERHHSFTGIDSAGEHDFFSTNGADFNEAELHLGIVMDNPDTRSVTSIIDGADRHENRCGFGA